MLLRALVLAEALLINHLGEREVNSRAGAASQDHIYINKQPLALTLVPVVI